MGRNAFARACCFIVLVFSTIGCPLAGVTGPKDQTPAPPFQGPVDPSFEVETGTWSLVYTAGPTIAFGGRSLVQIKTGTGFLPSSGIRFASLNSYNNFSAPQTALYQDNVDLTRSTTMSFDYTVEGFAGAGGGKATLQILFTSNGTQTLWTRTIDAASTLPFQKKGETVTLPTTTAAGRLTVQLVVEGGTVPPNNITQTNVTFGVDNIIVK